MGADGRDYWRCGFCGGLYGERLRFDSGDLFDVGHYDVYRGNAMEAVRAVWYCGGDLCGALDYDCTASSRAHRGL